MTARSTVQGKIIGLQESRLRLISTTGQGYLLTLSPFANVTTDNLRSWLQAGTIVTISYQGEPGLASGVARRIEPDGAETDG